MRVDHSKTVVLPNPVAVGTGPRAPAPATILFVGKLEERKGITTLIRSFHRVRASQSDAELRLCGDNTSSLSKFSMSELERIRVLGWVTQEELEIELRHATCLCLPTRGEGVPMAVLEAMALRCPVVTTLAGGLVDLVEHGVTGFVVAVDDVSGLAETLLYVIGDRPARERVAETAARMVMESHGLECVDRGLADLYSDGEVSHGSVADRLRATRTERSQAGPTRSEPACE
jgi:glycosyltransferase involved in cell wall biosynthesis